MRNFVMSFVIVLTLSLNLVSETMVQAEVQTNSTPTHYQIKRGENLQKVSRQFYGAKKYWQDLALVNRIPKADDIWPGETIFVPTPATIRKLHRAGSLSKVNRLLEQEQLQAAPAPVAQAQTRDSSSQVILPDTTAGTDSSRLATAPTAAASGRQWMWIGLLLFGVPFMIILGGVIGFIIYRNKHDAKEAWLESQAPVVSHQEPAAPVNGHLYKSEPRKTNYYILF